MYELKIQSTQEVAKRYKKDLNAELDYAWDFTDWLADDTIANVDILFEDGTALSLIDVETDGKIVVAWIGGGELGKTHLATCRITTASTPPRKEDRTVSFFITQR